VNGNGRTYWLPMPSTYVPGMNGYITAFTTPARFLIGAEIRP
jgi:hypothetical protein